MATGGFAANPELINKYSKFSTGELMINVGGPGNTGDGVNMVLEAGGVENHNNIGCLLLFPFMRDKAIVSHTNCAAMQPYLWVDKYGKRFTDETVALNFGHAGDMVASMPGAMLLVDHRPGGDQAPGRRRQRGRSRHLHPQLREAPRPADGDRRGRRRPNRTNVEGAATIAELAAKIGVDPKVLVDQVEAYNAAVKARNDAKFHKPAKYLLPILEGPFYAVKMETGIMISMGAMKIDDHWRAIGEDDKPIPGLYIVGVDAGGMWGESYSLPIPGSANGFSVTSGWLAADDIAEQVKDGVLV